MDEEWIAGTERSPVQIRVGGLLEGGARSSPPSLFLFKPFIFYSHRFINRQ